MLREMIMSGFGGQGALLIGQVLAIAGTVETSMPSGVLPTARKSGAALPTAT